ncbi:MAG: hypothetical protein ABL900_05495, partial [Burkholderiaceae bacterium]
VTPTRAHLTRLMKVWRSGGWPCRDALEIDLLAAKWVTLTVADSGHETLRLTDLGIRLLAHARQTAQRASSDHDRLAGRMARQLAQSGRIVWRELSLRAQVSADAPRVDAAMQEASEALWDDARKGTAEHPAPQSAAHRMWRVARPDVFSLRHTSVESYLQPMVHEVKVSRADLLSDLRHTSKRESYQWLSCETYFVFPAQIAELQEIPQDFGVWVLTGSIEEGSLELLRPARHSPCTLPFAVWMALAKSTPEQFDTDASQGQLGGPADDAPSDAPGDGPGDAPLDT